MCRYSWNIGDMTHGAAVIVNINDKTSKNLYFPCNLLKY